MNAHPALFDATVRRSIEEEIERLIALLDQIDPDADLEPDLDGEPDQEGEPSLGWTATMDQSVSGKSAFPGVLDGEEDVGEMRQDDPAEYEAQSWSNGPDLPQEGFNWHGHAAGSNASRNSDTAAA